MNTYKGTYGKSTEGTSLQHSEQLKLQTNAQETENNNGSSKILEIEEVNNTPFHIVKQENTGWFLTMGNERLTEPTENKQEILEMLSPVPWHLIMNMILIVNKVLTQHKENVKMTGVHEEGDIPHINR